MWYMDTLMKNGFEILPDTGDTRMKVWGRTLEELFRAALRGTVSYWRPELLEVKKKGLKEKKEIKVETVDLTALLIEFLSEVIEEADILNTAFVDVRFKKFGENFLEGVLYGVKVDGFNKDIKAVSYYEVDIKKNPDTGMYETTLAFDT